MLVIVDYENVQSIRAMDVPRDAEILFVCGAKQKSLPMELFLLQQELGSRFRVVAVRNVQANAADFCVAYYLGETLARAPETECIVVSKDKKGFDPLIAHLTKERGLRVRRLEALKTVRAQATRVPTNDVERAITLFRRERAQPKSLVALKRKMKSYFPAISEKERDQLVAELLTRKVFIESDSGLAFRAP
ncbi:MAG: PIN domain-containing protein [Hyphomicrobiales bacterium]